jgi:hypothetical protein
MIYIFYDKKRHSKENIELIYSFETDEEYIQYMKENYYMTDDFELPPSPISGLALEPDVDGLDAVESDDSGGFEEYTTFGILLNTNNLPDLNSPFIDEDTKEYIREVITLERDRKIDNVL